MKTSFLCVLLILVGMVSARAQGNNVVLHLSLSSQHHISTLVVPHKGTHGVDTFTRFIPVDAQLNIALDTTLPMRDTIQYAGNITYGVPAMSVYFVVDAMQLLLRHVYLESAVSTPSYDGILFTISNALIDSVRLVRKAHGFEAHDVPLSSTLSWNAYFYSNQWPLDTGGIGHTGVEEDILSLTLLFHDVASVIRGAVSQSPEITDFTIANENGRLLARFEPSEMERRLKVMNVMGEKVFETRIAIGIQECELPRTLKGLLFVKIGNSIIKVALGSYF